MPEEKEPDWTIPAIDSFGVAKSYFHEWDPRVKIISLLIFCFIIISLDTVLWCLIAFLISWITIFISRLPVERPLRRLKAMAGFLSIFLIVMPLTSAHHPGEKVVVISGMTALQWHLDGFYLAFLVILKACAVAVMMEPLFSTAPLDVTLYSLSRLGIPQQVCQMIILSHRYIYVFTHEAKRMYLGMRLRGFRRNVSINTMRAMGNFLGMLFVRSFDRTNSVYDAMLSRGYNGQFPSFVDLQCVKSDWLKGVTWIFLGFFLLIIEKII